jgi:hypothetical protein
MPVHRYRKTSNQEIQSNIPPSVWIGDPCLAKAAGYIHCASDTLSGMIWRRKSVRLVLCGSLEVAATTKIKKKKNQNNSLQIDCFAKNIN